MLKTKKKVKKSVPKPSVLLERALALFGPKGEYWIIGEEKSLREASFLYKGKIFDVDDAMDEISELVGSDATKLAKVVKEFVLVEEANTFCSIGAVIEVNTSNQVAAEQFLASAISENYLTARKKDHLEDDPDGGCECAECQGFDHESIITDANDSLDDDPTVSFPTVRGWFKKAIKLAKAAGQ
jgi:hypothetical protein